MNAPHPTAQQRQQLYQDMSPHNLTPLWEVLHALVPTSPSSPCAPALWKYEHVRPYLKRAGEVITAEEAIRRVLILENPALRGQSAITQSLYAGLQLILPGEIAPSHRHTQSALRFIVEGSGAYTAVDGERTTMHPGDFIITPKWTWHDHGNEASEPVVWLDGLDIPMIRFFDAGFAENNTEKSQTVSRTEGSSFARYGHNMAPVRGDAPFGGTSPIFNYPYARSREALHQLERDTPLDPWDGFKLRYVNPATGGSPMPTLGTFMQRLPAGFEGKASRQTDGAVYSVVEGAGTAYIESPSGSVRFDFEARDHFVVPSWQTVRFQSPSGCVLFSFSDRPVHQALGIHQEERLS
ncbi:MAG: gentisate 1,2-dioxygenase [Gammaproteobacteria bacterium]|nr:gentisate 1,2-dioxygenase [Gammaproteobacteria bacterium]MBU0786256.1 gentisate 1,2-dioxygenase [Gammaproteobacteria bacterium]MBU0814524.1 gentisate 1,2-dioxygenase [Gammaproteobacteria bacterium]MBU1786633.1 gentisate 1,2-dioxygenase [Gammaproteobacteria bacterium]